MVAECIGQRVRASHRVRIEWHTRFDCPIPEMRWSHVNEWSDDGALFSMISDYAAGHGL